MKGFVRVSVAAFPYQLEALGIHYALSNFLNWFGIIISVLR